MSIISDQEFRERDCPICGSVTEVITDISRDPQRSCTECNWTVAITGPYQVDPDSAYDRVLRDRIEELEERIEELENQI